MLVQLQINNLTVVRQALISFDRNMTAITGETGAGKSIALDALGLCLGERADSNIVRQGCDKAEIIAHFDVEHLQTFRDWLKENELEQEDNKNECFIRRIISNEGRSKAFVNGVQVTLQQLRALSLYLVNINGQHDHHHLLKKDNQLNFLDTFGNHQSALQQTAENCQKYQYITSKLAQLSAEQKQRADRVNLLEYQVQELDDFGLAEGEFADLEQDFKKATSIQSLGEASDKSCYLLKDGDHSNAIDLLNQASKELEHLLDTDESLRDSYDMLQSAVMQTQEAYLEIDKYRNSLDTDPEKIDAIEKRYGACIDMARKHQTTPEKLFELHMTLIAELENLKQMEAGLEALAIEKESAMQDYIESATSLSSIRQKSANQLSEQIQKNIRLLNMPHAQVNIRIFHSHEATPSAKGNDEIVFNLSLNPGQPPDAMEKVVSGGELSRIGLVLQVLKSKNQQTPTLVFDEVDTGISGQTASVVGKLLQSLGAKNQVICVTHLPQVAALAQHQILVDKVTDGKTTETKVLKLTPDRRVDEIARLLAGDEVSHSATDNAKALLGIN